LLCDGVAEAVSRRLSAFYRAEFGRVLHHNTDKVHLGAGRAEPAYGGGRVVNPIYVLVRTIVGSGGSTASSRT
jgi:S-adenosylmethionine synthetase